MGWASSQPCTGAGACSLRYVRILAGKKGVHYNYSLNLMYG
jgi:hypothetical protein